MSIKPKGTAANRGKKGRGGCAICRHERRHAIDLAITYGQSVRSVAEQFQVHYDALDRHTKRHLSASQRAAILTATKPSEVDVEALTKSESQGLLSSLIAMRARLAAHAQACTSAGDFKGAIHAERVTLADLELTAKLVGQLISRSEVRHEHLTLSPSYLKLRAALIRVLRPFPEIAQQVAAALAEIESDDAIEITTRAAKPTPAMIEHHATA
jgi:hypothetical protein